MLALRTVTYCTENEETPWWPEARVAPGSFPSMNAMLRAQLGSAVVTETDEQARERYRAQLADEGLAHHLR